MKARTGSHSGASGRGPLGLRTVSCRARDRSTDLTPTPLMPLPRGRKPQQGTRANSPPRLYSIPAGPRAKASFTGHRGEPPKGLPATSSLRSQLRIFMTQEQLKQAASPGRAHSVPTQEHLRFRSTTSSINIELRENPSEVRRERARRRVLTAGHLNCLPSVDYFREAMYGGARKILQYQVPSRKNSVGRGMNALTASRAAKEDLGRGVAQVMELVQNYVFEERVDAKSRSSESSSHRWSEDSTQKAKFATSQTDTFLQRGTFQKPFLFRNSPAIYDQPAILENVPISILPKAGVLSPTYLHEQENRSLMSLSAPYATAHLEESSQIESTPAEQYESLPRASMCEEPVFPAHFIGNDDHSHAQYLPVYREGDLSQITDLPASSVCHDDTNLVSAPDAKPRGQHNGASETNLNNIDSLAVRLDVRAISHKLRMREHAPASPAISAVKQTNDLNLVEQLSNLLLSFSLHRYCIGGSCAKAALEILHREGVATLFDIMRLSRLVLYRRECEMNTHIRCSSESNTCTGPQVVTGSLTPDAFAYAEQADTKKRNMQEKRTSSGSMREDCVSHTTGLLETLASIKNSNSSAPRPGFANKTVPCRCITAIFDALSRARFVSTCCTVLLRCLPERMFDTYLLSPVGLFIGSVSHLSCQPSGKAMIYTVTKLMHECSGLRPSLAPVHISDAEYVLNAAVLAASCEKEIYLVSVYRSALYREGMLYELAIDSCIYALMGMLAKASERELLTATHEEGSAELKHNPGVQYKAINKLSIFQDLCEELPIIYSKIYRGEYTALDMLKAYAKVVPLELTCSFRLFESLGLIMQNSSFELHTTNYPRIRLVLALLLHVLAGLILSHSPDLGVRAGVFKHCSDAFEIGRDIDPFLLLNIAFSIGTTLSTILSRSVWAKVFQSAHLDSAAPENGEDVWVFLRYVDYVCRVSNTLLGIVVQALRPADFLRLDNLEIGGIFAWNSTEKCDIPAPFIFLVTEKDPASLLDLETPSDRGAMQSMLRCYCVAVIIRTVRSALDLSAVSNFDCLPILRCKTNIALYQALSTLASPTVSRIPLVAWFLKTVGQMLPEKAPTSAVKKNDIASIRPERGEGSKKLRATRFRPAAEVDR